MARRGEGRELCLQSAAFYVKFNIKASLEAVFVAVLDVLPVGLAFHAHFRVVGQVGELHRHQWLQVLWLQGLAIVRVVLQGKAGVAAHPVVLHCAYFVCILLSLGVEKGRTNNDNHSDTALCSPSPWQQLLFFGKTLVGHHRSPPWQHKVCPVERTLKCCLTSSYTISTSQHAAARKRAFLYLKPQPLHTFRKH